MWPGLFVSRRVQYRPVPLVLILGIGFLLGLRHALEADHVVAVSTIVGRCGSVWRSSIVGAFWGLGHTAALLVATIFVLLFRVAIPANTALGLEFIVGLVIVALGIGLLRQLIRDGMTVHAHDRKGGRHLHLHRNAATADAHARAHRMRPFLVGVLHGLAGSATLTLFVLSTLSSAWAALAYVLVFGVGTIAGMLAMSAAIGLPFRLAAAGGVKLVVPVQGAAALSSIAFGLWYAYRAIAP